MIIKKYTGKTESEATEIAKKELGENIVIMNVRPVKKSGFFAFFAPSRIEVTVALEDEPAKTTRAVKPQHAVQAKPVKTVHGNNSVAEKLHKAQEQGEIPPLKVKSPSPPEPVKAVITQDDSSVTFPVSQKKS